jgi:hypothetical protein
MRRAADENQQAVNLGSHSPVTKEL